jgi:hypothetical protein
MEHTVNEIAISDTPARALRLLGCLILLLAVRPAVAVEPLPGDFMPASQVKPGMIGEGRTVFKGYKVESFKVEILGVQHNNMAGSDMIIGKLEGPMLEKHGVVAGMSGSPVFINGKLIGAVSYCWSYSYAPYCGITPIEQMWTVWQSIGQPSLAEVRDGGPSQVASAAPSSGGGNAWSQAWDWESDWKQYQRMLSGEKSAVKRDSVAAGFRPDLPELANVKGEMQPVWSPMFVSGASPATEKLLRGFFASRGIELMGSGSLSGSGSGSGPAEPAPPLENGSAVGVPLLSGDLSLAGVGTVTYRKGDKMIAFGHPMFFKGGTSAPMAQAYILGFMQSYERSFKMGDVREVIGTIDQNRLFAIGGKLGQGPDRVPITVTVQGSGSSRPRAYHFSCWKNREFLPTMSASAAQEAYSASVAEGGDLTAKIGYAVTLGDGRVIRKSFVESARGDVISQPITSMLFDMFMLVENPFHEADVRSIDMTIDVKSGVHQDTLVAARLQHPAYRPGDRVSVIGRFRPWHGLEFEREFSLDLPRDLAEGSYVLHLADSQGSMRVERSNHPCSFAPRDFDGVIDLIRNSDISDDELRLYLFEPATDVHVAGYAMDRLPGSMGTLIQNTAPVQTQYQSIGREVASQVHHTDGLVIGSQSLIVQVSNHIDE